jgi:hypothetical protein
VAPRRSNVGLDLTATQSGQEFVNTAAKRDAFEIAAAKLAATNASSLWAKTEVKRGCLTIVWHRQPLAQRIMRASTIVIDLQTQIRPLGSCAFVLRRYKSLARGPFRNEARSLELLF